MLCVIEFLTAKIHKKIHFYEDKQEKKSKNQKNIVILHQNKQKQQ